MPDFEKFILAYQKASPELKEFIDSERIGEFTDTLLINPELKQLKKNLLLEMSHYVLRANSESDFISNLKNIGFSNDFIINNLNTIKEFVTGAQKLDPSLGKRGDPNSIPAITPPPSSTIPPTSIQPPPETTYTSTQAAILTEKPASNFSEGAKWGSDD